MKLTKTNVNKLNNNMSCGKKIAKGQVEKRLLRNGWKKKSEMFDKLKTAIFLMDNY